MNYLWEGDVTQLVGFNSIPTFDEFCLRAVTTVFAALGEACTEVEMGRFGNGVAILQ